MQAGRQIDVSANFEGISCKRGELNRKKIQANLRRPIPVDP